MKIAEVNPKACIFDFDGTLVDSMWVWERVDREFMIKRGLEYTREHTEALAVLGFEGSADYFIDVFGLDERPEDLIKEWQHMALDKYANEVQLKPGARELLEGLHAQGMPIAIATSLQRMLLEPALRNRGILDLFGAVCVCEEVCEGGKSTPAVYEEAARQLGVPLNECLIFEDVAKAARSAKKGGATVVGVRDDHEQQNREELIEAADYFIEGFDGLL